MTNEIWKPISAFEGRYEVSDLGRVRGPSGRVLKPGKTNSGYLIVHLMRQGKRHARTVHRLVAAVFCEGYEPGLHVNHKDHERLNNTATNLEWVTRSQNMLHSSRAGRANPTRHAVIGVSLVDGHVVHYPSKSAAEIALAGRNSSAVHHCMVGKKRSAYGYTWSMT